MSMSRDRVHFELDTLNSNHATRTAFMQAFGTQFPASSRSGVGVLTIICRPSQFARFLIYRNEHGGQNLFKELNAKLVPAAADPPLLDVSGNPAQ